MEFLNTLLFEQVGQLQQRHGRLRDVGHGQTDGGRPGSVRAGQRDRLLGKQLRRRARQTMRVQEVSRPHTENRRFRVSGRQFFGRLPGAVPQFAVQVSFVRLRRHWRIRMQTQSSLQGHVSRHTGKRKKLPILVRIYFGTSSKN